MHPQQPLFIKGMDSKNENDTDQEVINRHRYPVELSSWLAMKEERKRLREKHENATKNRPTRSFFKNLDGTVKKTTAFVKKLKTSITEQQQQFILEDFEKLNLTKFVSEVARTMVEAGLTKHVDLKTAILLASNMHMRYADFDLALKAAFENQLKHPEPDDKNAIALFKYDIFFFTTLN